MGTIKIDLDDAMENDWRVKADNEVAATIPTHQRCERCEGTGNEFMFTYRKCQDCNGTGIAKGATIS